MAQRGRPRKNPPKESNENINITKQDYFEEFAKTVQTPALNALLGVNWMQNPYYMNSLIKWQDGSPLKYTREQIVQFINNPMQNEQSIRNMHLYFYYTNLFYKRVVEYFASMLIFKYNLYPCGLSRKEMNGSAFQKSFTRTKSWLRKFNVEETFRNIMETLIGEDVFFGYIRESKNGISIQKMPSDPQWCKIIRRTEYGFQYAFNFMYFFRPNSMAVDDFDPWFVEKLIELFGEDWNSANNKDVMMSCWVELDPKIAPCFKFNNIQSTVISPMLGVFLDLVEIDDYRQLKKTRTTLDTVQLLCQKIPTREKDNGTANKSPMLLDGTTARKYHEAVKSDLPEGVRVVTTPMSIESIRFDKAAENKDDIVGTAASNYYKSSGVSEMLFNSDDMSGMALLKSIESDSSYVDHLYLQFERFLTTQINKISGGFEYRLEFSRLTKYNVDDKLPLYLQSAQYGFPKGKILNCLGYNNIDIQEVNDFEDFLGLNELTPLMNSHVMSGSDLTNKGGRPKNQGGKVSESTEEVQNTEGNANRGTGISY